MKDSVISLSDPCHQKWVIFRHWWFLRFKNMNLAEKKFYLLSLLFMLSN